jgi:hypothetical protein
MNVAFPIVPVSIVLPPHDMAAIFGSCLPGGGGGGGVARGVHCVCEATWHRGQRGPSPESLPQGCNPCPYWVKMKFTLCTQLFFSPCIFGTTEHNIEILTLII